MLTPPPSLSRTAVQRRPTRRFVSAVCSVRDGHRWRRAKARAGQGGAESGSDGRGGDGCRRGAGGGGRTPLGDVEAGEGGRTPLGDVEVVGCCTNALLAATWTDEDIEGATEDGLSGRRARGLELALRDARCDAGLVSWLAFTLATGTAPADDALPSAERVLSMRSSRILLPSASA